MLSVVSFLVNFAFFVSVVFIFGSIWCIHFNLLLNDIYVLAILASIECTFSDKWDNMVILERIVCVYVSVWCDNCVTISVRVTDFI